MGWRSLLQEENEFVVLPWVGGRLLRHGSRTWKIAGQKPRDHGWYRWSIAGRHAEVAGKHDAVSPVEGVRFGYLVGDLFVSDNEGGEVKDPAEMAGRFSRTRLISEDVDHFARVSVSQWWDQGPLVFSQMEFPLGPEDDVRDAFLDEKPIEDIPGVPPALYLAFRMKIWHQAEVVRRREEERLRREEREKRERFEKTLGNGAVRRELAKEDFEAAAKAALAIGGADLIECRPSTEQNGEYVVRYRVDGSRYECVCDERMSIVDAGICLTDESTGEKGDTYFTLESLPGVTREAMAAGAVIWRRV